MATVYRWPAWPASAFEMRVVPNVSAFTSPYTKAVQTLDMLGERWTARVAMPAHVDPVIGAAREAYFDRLRGPVNLIGLWHLRRPRPQGTVCGLPTVSGAVAQLANLVNIQSTAFATVLAGDQFGIGGQLVRVMASVTADSTGLLTGVEVMPRFRVAVASGASVAWDRPTANFMLKADGVPVVHRVGMFEGSALDLIEVF